MHFDGTKNFVTLKYVVCLCSVMMLLCLKQQLLLLLKLLKISLHVVIKIIFDVFMQALYVKIKKKS